MIKKYSGSKLYEKIGKTNINFLYTVIVSFENFLQFLQSDTEYIDYTYLWDIICSPESQLFVSEEDNKQNGVNLIILDITNNDATNRVEILCPSNCYSKHIHKANKKSIILIKQTNISPDTNMYYDTFEPIISFQKKDNNKHIIESLFENKENVPEQVTKIIEKIQSNLFDKCDLLRCQVCPKNINLKKTSH